ncbi:unnamed protein product, partial [marine sediment metagenome]
TILFDHNQLLLWMNSQPKNINVYNQIPTDYDLHSLYIIRNNNSYYILQTFYPPTLNRAIRFMDIYNKYGINLGPDIKYSINVGDQSVNPVIDYTQKFDTINIPTFVKYKDEYAIIIPLKNPGPFVPFKVSAQNTHGYPCSSQLSHFSSSYGFS